MAKLSPMNWTLWRKQAEENAERGYGGALETYSVRDILALLDSRDTLLRTLEAIKAECPARPTKPLIKKIVELVNTGIKEAANGD